VVEGIANQTKAPRNMEGNGRTSRHGHQYQIKEIGEGEHTRVHQKQ